MMTNDSVFPYELNTHAAHMLLNGIKGYVKLILREHKDGELPSYCCLMLGTAKIEADRLMQWMKINKNRNKLSIEILKELIAKINSLSKKFFVLEQKELAELKRKNNERRNTQDQRT
jgi:phosphomevalonate kinase